MAKARDQHFVQFQDHTLLKHAILRRYLSTWANKLLSWRGRDYERIWFVDAFAGAGQDQLGNPGSPLIAARIAGGLHSQRQSERAPVRIVAIEKEEGVYKTLVNVVSGFASGQARVIDVRRGTLADYLAPLMEHVDGEPVLFFLDPFGVDGLRADLLELMLQGRHNEVFALFSDTGAHRLLALLSKEERSTDEEVREVLRTPSLFSELDQARVAEVLADVERSNQGLTGTKPHAQRILIEALGEQAVEKLLSSPSEERQIQAARLWREALRDAGAGHTVALPIRNAAGGQLHQLVYASKSKTGLITMKDCMSASLRDSTLPSDVVDSMRFACRLEPELVLDRMKKTFGGQQLRWTGKGGLREWVLTETDALQLHLNEVKAAMDRRGWVKSKRPIEVQVPS